MVLSDKERERLLKDLGVWEQEGRDPDEGQEDRDSSSYRNYSLQTEKGRAFYESLSDEFLLGVLRNKAAGLGRSPSQKEMIWVWRLYIRTRFKKWPYALKAAGLSKAAGRDGVSFQKHQREKEEYLQLFPLIQDKAVKLCRIPHPREVPEIEKALARYGVSWADFIRQAGLDGEFFHRRAVYQAGNLDEQDRQRLKLVLKAAWDLGRPPLKRELPQDVIRPLIQKCGSYRNVLFQIGLEPVEKKSPFIAASGKPGKEKLQRKHQVDLKDCYYQVLNRDAQFQRDLKALCDWTQKKGRLPGREEIDPEMRKRLQRSCGSWSNALRQLYYRKK